MKAVMFWLSLVVIAGTAHPMEPNDNIVQGKELVQNGYYDEALKILEPIEGDDIELLFYRGCCSFHLLDKESAVRDLNLLLSHDVIPKRYFHLAHRMIAEIKPLKEDTLDEISRLIKDNGRRVGLNQIGDTTTDQQQLIIDKLDKLIEQAEQQQQQQQQAAAQAQSQSQGKQQNQSSPLDKSEYRDTMGQGNSDKRNLDMKDGWGNLPPAERNEALQPIVRDLPWHYREAIEAYFRKMATDQ